MCCGGCKRRTCGEQWSQRAAAQTRRATGCRDESALAPGFNHRYSNGTSVKSVVEFSDFEAYSRRLFPPHHVALQLQPSPQQRRAGGRAAGAARLAAAAARPRPATQPHFGSKWMRLPVIQASQHKTKARRWAKPVSRVVDACQSDRTPNTGNLHYRDSVLQPTHVCAVHS